MYQYIQNFVKTIGSVLLLLTNTFLQAQDIKQSTIQKFSVVCDSVSKLMNSNNSITIKTCEGYDALYLTKDSLHWKGYYLKNLDSVGHLPDLADGKPILTELIAFDAGSVYNDLVKLKIYTVKQFSENELQELYSRPKQKKGKYHTVYSLPYASDDCTMAITITGKKHLSASYRNALISSKETHIIEVVKAFYNIETYLTEKFK